MRYQQRPVEVEAFQVPVDGNGDQRPFNAWATSVGLTCYWGYGRSGANDTVVICRPEGDLLARPGSWVVRDLLGVDFAVYTDEQFRQNFKPTDRYRHNKRGTFYDVLLTDVKLESDKEPLVIYRAEDGTLWARPTAEFLDGRFTKLESE